MVVAEDSGYFKSDEEYNLAYELNYQKDRNFEEIQFHLLDDDQWDLISSARVVYHGTAVDLLEAGYGETLRSIHAGEY